MKVFVTGATGFIGSAVVRELLDAGHGVLGLARSDAGAESLAAMGAGVLRGDMEHPESLRSGVAQTDAVIHTAFLHDWTNFAASCAMDRQAIETIGHAIEGSNRPLLVSSGLATRGIASGRPATENDAPLPASPEFPRASEAAAETLVKRGVNAAVVRLPQVHNTVKQGLVSYMVAVARQKGVSAYIDDGATRWSAVHITDAAHVFRLALEKCEPGARYHAVAEEALSQRTMAEAIGNRLKLPVISISADEAPEHFGFLARLLGFELFGSSTLTRAKLGWNPTGPDLLADIASLQEL